MPRPPVIPTRPSRGIVMFRYPDGAPYPRSAVTPSYRYAMPKPTMPSWDDVLINRPPAAAEPPLPPPPAPVTLAVAPEPPRAKVGGEKYTVLLDTAARLDLLTDVVELTRVLGRQPSWSAIVRTLLAQLHDDPRVLAETARRLNGVMS